MRLEHDLFQMLKESNRRIRQDASSNNHAHHQEICDAYSVFKCLEKGETVFTPPAVFVKNLQDDFLPIMSHFEKGLLVRMFPVGTHPTDTQRWMFLPYDFARKLMPALFRLGRDWPVNLCSNELFLLQLVLSFFRLVTKYPNFHYSFHVVYFSVGKCRLRPWSRGDTRMV